MEIVLGLFNSTRFIQLTAQGKLSFGGFRCKYDHIPTTDVERIIISAMLDAEEIHFTLDGYQIHAANDFELSYTQFELWLVLNNYELRAKTIFYDWPYEYSEDEVLRMIEPSIAHQAMLIQILDEECDKR